MTEPTTPDPLTPVLTRRWQSPRAWSIEAYEQLEGYSALRFALRGHPDQLIELVKESGLRGRGGAGFPTGMKWGFIPQGPTGPGAKPKYLVVNADEGEPGTCKDIPTMMADPHSLIEGCIITSYAIRAKFCAIYIRGEALHPLRRVRYAVEQAYARGYLGRNILGSGFDLDIVVHAGAGAYICGEETALLDSLEGRRGQPRLKPPFPATAGLYASPTVVNNVETIATVPAIVQGGSSWFRTMGSEKSPGPKIYSLSGHVDAARPVRGSAGHHAAGAARAGRRHEGRDPAQVLDAGRVVDAAVHRPAPRRPARLRGRRRRRVDARHHGRAGVQRDRLGAVGGHEVDRVLQARELRKVHALPGGHVLAACRYSSGCCTGRAPRADVETLLDVCDNILGRSFCALGDGATSPITSAIKYFRQEFLDLVAAQPVVAQPDQLPELDRSRSMTLTPEKQGTAEEKQPRPLPEGHVRLTIDGEEVDAPKGELIIRTCERLGIIVPRFCDHPLLDPAGACRQCLVEVEMGGRPMPKPQASCTMTVADGMVVRTQHSSPVAKKAQEGVMELLLINHPLDCPICDKGGECPLQNQAMSTGRTDSRFVDVKRTFPKPLPISTQVLLDRERCVLCQRCTRFSEEIAGDPFIDLLERGALQQIGVAQDKPFQSYFSGNTIQICPVGALTSAEYRFRARPFDLVSTDGVVRALRLGVRPARRQPPRHHHAPARRQRPRGERGVELRQGPIRLPLPPLARAHHAADGPRRGRRAGRGVLDRGAAGGRRGSARGAASPRRT